jgi:hypothetical protein
MTCQLNPSADHLLRKERAGKEMPPSLDAPVPKVDRNESLRTASDILPRWPGSAGLTIGIFSTQAFGQLPLTASATRAWVFVSSCCRYPTIIRFMGEGLRCRGSARCRGQQSECGIMALASGLLPSDSTIKSLASRHFLKCLNNTTCHGILQCSLT